MPRKKQEPQTKVCTYCKTKYQTTRTDQKYCLPSCREKHNQEKLKIERAREAEVRKKKQSLRRSELFDESGFASLLVRECKRAGTVEILKHTDSEGLLALLQLTRNRNSYAGLDSGKVGTGFHLSHIYPVAGGNRIGLYSVSNLVISSDVYNRKRSNKIPTTLDNLDLYSISKSDLQSRYLVTASDSNSSVILKIKRYLGSEVLDGFYKVARQTKTEKNKLIDKLVKLGFNKSKLKSLEKEELHELLQSKGVATQAAYSRPALSEIEVCKLELIRTSSTDSVLFWIAEALTQCRNKDKRNTPDINWNLSYPKNRFEEFVVLQINNLLHKEPYSLGIEQKHLIEYFSIKEGSIATSKLESVLIERQQFSKTRGDYYYDTVINF